MDTKHKTVFGSKGGSNDMLLEEFFFEELRDIYWAEKNLIDAFHLMGMAANTSKLRDAFMSHTEITANHIFRLEQVFSIFGQPPIAVKCEAMAGLIDESESVINETEKGTITRDVGLIMAAQKEEHYEIATYGGLIHLAKTLGRDDVVKLLEATLDEVKETDRLLSDIAQNDIY